MKKSNRRYQRPQIDAVPVGPVMVERLSHEGRGVAHAADGKTVFIDGAVPGDQVMYKVTRRKASFDDAQLAEILQPSAQRVTPPCEFFARCGGCTLQHVSTEFQLTHKQAMLTEQLTHFANVQPQQGYLVPLTAADLGYRRKTRLSCKFVIKKDQVLVGFREKNSHFVADIERCVVLDPRISEHLSALKILIAQLDAKDAIPQVEVAAGDAQVAMVVRHLRPLTASDHAAWLSFCQARDWHLYFQPSGLDSVHKVWPEGIDRLTYALPTFDLQLQFHPLDFIQVNRGMNEKLIEHALQLLKPQAHERVLDLFCGLGNFTLPLARLAGHVVGVEGSADLVARGDENAKLNQLTNVEFYAADLFLPIADTAPWAQRYDAVLLDPPRAGAEALIDWIAAVAQPARIVYVSCNPATLARDSGRLAQLGYRLQQAGLVDMFPHTAHAEALAYFERMI
jgi:23S rRNA (uracil1939-C5)-methyltransferase